MQNRPHHSKSILAHQPRPFIFILAALAFAIMLTFLAQASVQPAHAQWHAHQQAPAPAPIDPHVADLVWTSAHWANGSSRTLRAGQRDGHDPSGWSEAVGPSGISAEIDGKGVLALSGNQPRLYINSGEHGNREFTDVEVTAYYRRVKDNNTSWGGLTIGVRSGPDSHGSPRGDDCDAHSYYMRFMHNGAIDFDKELAHPNHSSRARKNGVFGDSLPSGEWIGGRFRVYNLPNGHVKLEAYADFGDGVWKLVNETVDDGTWASGGSAAQCSRWSSDKDIYTGSGLVFIRNTNVDRAEYRDLSVREISAPSYEPQPVSVPFRINAGGDEFMDGDGKSWHADQPYNSGGGWGYVQGTRPIGTASHDLHVACTNEPEIYSTERWGMDSYRIDVEDGEYDVRLLFAETYRDITAPGQRVFGISIEGVPVPPALDIFAEAGFQTALVKEIRNVQVSDGRLDINFQKHKDSPTLKGIEVLSGGTLPTATPTLTPVDGAAALACPGTPASSATPNPTPVPPPLAEVITRHKLSNIAWQALRNGMCGLGGCISLN